MPHCHMHAVACSSNWENDQATHALPGKFANLSKSVKWATEVLSGKIGSWSQKKQIKHLGDNFKGMLWHAVVVQATGTLPDKIEDS